MHTSFLVCLLVFIGAEVSPITRLWGWFNFTLADGLRVLSFNSSDDISWIFSIGSYTSFVVWLYSVFASFSTSSSIWFSDITNIGGEISHSSESSWVGPASSTTTFADSMTVDIVRLNTL